MSKKWMEHKAELIRLDNEGFFNSRSSQIEQSIKPRVASFFSGCGGMDLGLQWAGYDLVYANEIDSSASLTYEENFKHRVQNISITKVDFAEIPAHDILVGGFPCQPFSYAGKRKGLDDDRGMLFFALIEDLYINRPKFFIFENVKGLMTQDNGKTLTQVKHAVADAGYKMSYSLLNAEDFLCPQKRQRLILVGVREDLAGSFEFPAYSLPPVSIKQAIGNIVETGILPNHEPMKHSQRIVDRYKFIPQGGDMRDVPPEHQQRKRGNVNEISGKRSSQSYNRLLENEPSPTVCAMFQAHFIHFSEHRNLTAREAARLQSFPDDFVFRGKRVNMSWDSNLSQYQQIGNAVPPKLAFVIGRALYDQFYSNHHSTREQDSGAYFL
jgi:DNA (cytosine-5)-methyltransferase 1